jgi:hypothetical protein
LPRQPVHPRDGEPSEGVVQQGLDRNPSKTIAAVAERSCEKLLKELPRRLA